jgi:hypothetical protein
MFLRLEDEDDSNLGVWWDAAQLACLLLPSSATAERVFSLSANMFGNKQSTMLIDSLKLGLFTHYNRVK